MQVWFPLVSDGFLYTITHLVLEGGSEQALQREPEQDFGEG